MSNISVVTKTDFANLYILDAINFYLDDKNKSKREKLILNIAEYYKIQLKIALLSEIKYINGSKVSWPFEKDKISILCENGIYDGSLESKKIDTLSNKQIQILFYNLDWRAEYGGQAWGDIAGLLIELENELNNKDKNVSNLMFLIDRIHQAQHNTGTVFNDFSGNEKEWIEDLLTEKSISESIKVLKQYASSYVLKALNTSPISELVDGEIDQQLLISEFSEIEIQRAKNKCSSFLNRTLYPKYELLSNRLSNGSINQKQYNENIAALEDYKKLYEKKLHDRGNLIYNHFMYRSDIAISRVASYLVLNSEIEQLYELIKNQSMCSKISPNVILPLVNINIINEKQRIYILAITKEIIRNFEYRTENNDSYKILFKMIKDNNISREELEIYFGSKKFKQLKELVC